MKVMQMLKVAMVVLLLFSGLLHYSAGRADG